MDFLRGMRLEYWCSRMAIYGCKDPAVTLWLKAEYDAFQDGDGLTKVGEHQWMFPSLFSSSFPDLRSHVARSVTRVEFSIPATACSRATSAS